MELNKYIKYATKVGIIAVIVGVGGQILWAWIFWNSSLFIYHTVIAAVAIVVSVIAIFLPLI